LRNIPDDFDALLDLEEHIFQEQNNSIAINSSKKERPLFFNASNDDEDAIETYFSSTQIHTDKRSPQFNEKLQSQNQFESPFQNYAFTVDNLTSSGLNLELESAISLNLGESSSRCPFTSIENDFSITDSNPRFIEEQLPSTLFFKNKENESNSSLSCPPYFSYAFPPKGRTYSQCTLASGKCLFFPSRTRNACGSYSYVINKDELSNVFQWQHQDDENQSSAIDNGIETMSEPLLDGMVPETDLWVDKYHPQTYLDLIIDEATARDVLSWVKQWDFCVFGAAAAPFLSVRSSAKYKNVTGIASIIPKIEDHLKRPYKRILLISGAPGLGKTSMINVIAKLTGYDITEINASDDRSLQAVQDRLSNALGSTSISMGKLCMRPKLIVIDEIDGALNSSESGFISTLCKLAEHKYYSKSKSHQSSATVKKDSFELRRPIICICNNLYVPALRQLRQVAKVIHIQPSHNMLPLVRRLSDISTMENLQIESQTLHWLAARSGGDIRSCLNSLQFAKRLRDHSNTLNNKQGVIRATFVSKSDFESMNLSMKDQSSNLFEVWESLFSSKINEKVLAKIKLQPRHSSSNLDLMIQVLERNSEYDKIVNGCHEFYPKFRFYDFERFGPLAQLFVKFDQMNSKSYSMVTHAGFSLQTFLPWILSQLHWFYQANIVIDSGSQFSGTLKFEYPQMDFTAFQAQKERSMVLKGVRGISAPLNYISWSGSPETTVLDVVHPLSKILAPIRLRSTHLKLMSLNERKTLDSLVELMRDLKIQLIPSKTENIEFFTLEPYVFRIIS
jgi:chromosome transmission fidelity protein 18